MLKSHIYYIGLWKKVIIRQNYIFENKDDVEIMNSS